MNFITKHLIIQGRVQGVGYRYSMFHAAKNFGVTGWVRNQRDGTVEAMAAGDEKAVQSLVEWAKKGPALAEVESVEVTDGGGTFDDFEIKENI